MDMLILLGATMLFFLKLMIALGALYAFDHFTHHSILYLIMYTIIGWKKLTSMI